MTEKVFRDNRSMGRNELTRRLQDLLRVDELIVIPTEPHDLFGHADGVLRFVDAGTVLINDYSTVARSYQRRLTKVLFRAGLEYHEIPYVPREERPGEVPPAFGCYTNFLWVGA